jgi:hypothetical protein
MPAESKNLDSMFRVLVNRRETFLGLLRFQEVPRKKAVEGGVDLKTSLKTFPAAAMEYICSTKFFLYLKEN